MILTKGYGNPHQSFDKENFTIWYVFCIFIAMKDTILKNKIQSDGVITLPTRFKNIFSHYVELIVKDLPSEPIIKKD